MFYFRWCQYVYSKFFYSGGALETAGNTEVGPQQSLKVCHTQQPSLSWAHNNRTTQRWPAERGIHGTHPYFTSSRYKTLAALLKPSQLKRRTQRQRMTSIAPFPLQRFHVVSEHWSVTAFVPMSAVLCSPFRFSVRISPESRRSCKHNIGQCRCQIRPASRLSMLLFAEMLSVPITRQSSCCSRPAKSITLWLLRRTPTEQHSRCEFLASNFWLWASWRDGYDEYTSCSSWWASVQRDRCRCPRVVPCSSLASSHSSTPSSSPCQALWASAVLTGGVVIDFTFTPSRFICANMISRWCESASISISLRDPDRHTEITSRCRVVSSPSTASWESTFHWALIRPTPVALNHPW